MSETIADMKRTDMCGTLRESDVGREVTLMGWCHKARDLGGLTFITLRDRSGEVQLVPALFYYQSYKKLTFITKMRKYVSIIIISQIIKQVN